MEVAANPEYQTSQYLNSLYQFCILEEDFSRPSLPPYYSASFFNTIREAKNEGNDIVRMSSRQCSGIFTLWTGKFSRKLCQMAHRRITYAESKGTVLILTGH